MLNLLTFTTLYPNEAAPNHGVFVENRLRHLIGAGLARARVLAPVPWFPSRAKVFGAWARHAAAPSHEIRHGITVDHPRFVAIPRVGMRIAPDLLYRAARPALAAMLAAGHQVDAIDAHYAYPDGVAAIALGRHFGLPVVITARGSDITQFPDYPAARRRILAAADAADAMITVSDGLRRALIALGAAPQKITVLRNGVDLVQFAPPANRAQARADLNLTGPTLVSVGALIARKGHDRTIAALTHLPNHTLLIAGEGEARASLQTLAANLGVAHRVRFLGSVPHAKLAALYGAADISVLASSREGWANVLLESLACATPAVASPIPGNDEVIASRDAGLIASANTPAAIADAVRTLTSNPPDRTQVRAYAERFSWDAVSAGQADVFARVLAARAKTPAHAQAATVFA